MLEYVRGKGWVECNVFVVTSENLMPGDKIINAFDHMGTRASWSNYPYFVAMGNKTEMLNCDGFIREAYSLSFWQEDRYRNWTFEIERL